MRKTSKKMSDLEDELVENPDIPKGRGDPDFYGYVGEHKPKVEKHYEPSNRRDDYPRDGVDYDPRTDDADWLTEEEKE